ncbi:MAG: hypothetical protein VYC34_12550, partial [Planctomycetota bacterium]|nr:hypothetical protein [Planctomycetota bacterium]
MNRAASVPFIALTTALIASPLAPAQQNADQPETPPPAQREIEPFTTPTGDRPREIEFSISGKGTYTFDTDIDAGGEVSITRGGVGVATRIPVAEKLTIGLEFDSEYSNYDFSGADFEGASDPFDDLYRYGGGVSFGYTINEEWAAFAAVRYAVAGESGVSNHDSGKWSGVAGAR